MVFNYWANIIVQSFFNSWQKVAMFLPDLVGALIVLLIGFVVAVGLAKLVEGIVHHLKIDSLLRWLNLETYFHRAGLELNAGYFLGELVFWFSLIVFFLASSDILGFFALSSFLGDVLLYIPHVVISFLILLVTLITANFLRGLAKSSVLGARLHAGKFLGSLAWWMVMIFGLLTAFYQLGIAKEIINTVITGAIAMFALAGGLAFGLGGKEEAGYLLHKLREEWEKH